MTPLVDSHAHLDLIPDAEAAIASAAGVGVEAILAVGIDLESSRKACSYAEDHDIVHAAVGIHPHDAGTTGDSDFSMLSELAGYGPVVAIGETGLDFYRDRSPRDLQRECFLNHIHLARRESLPLIVHSREAGEETLALLADEAQDLKVILHCFALTDYVDECAARGYFMSIAGNVTFKNAVSLRQAAASIPEELLLTETDAPYLAPDPYRGKPNTPAYVTHVLECLAGLRGTTTEALAPLIRSNFDRAFGLT